MSFENAGPAKGDQVERDARQIELDIDLIKRGASYEITGMPGELADELIKEQRGELYPDLATFIKANKIIACPAENIRPADAKLIQNAKGTICELYGKYYYIDHQGNIAAFQLGIPEIKLISSLKKANELNRITSNFMWDELEKLGFKPVLEVHDTRPMIMSAIIMSVNDRNEALAQEEEQRKKDEFDF